MIKDKLTVKFLISREPSNAKVAERAVPTAIFESEETIKKKFLRKWLK